MKKVENCPLFDFKKEYKDLYMPKGAPSLIKVPPITFVSVSGMGDPNQEGGEYQYAMSLLYGVSFTIKMSKMGGSTPEGYFDYVVPPLEGLWWMGRVVFCRAALIRGAMAWPSVGEERDGT
jgi:hypothetical protein